MTPGQYKQSMKIYYFFFPLSEYKMTEVRSPTDALPAHVYSLFTFLYSKYVGIAVNTSSFHSSDSFLHCLITFVSQTVFDALVTFSVCLVI